jgi:hypothetical protein
MKDASVGSAVKDCAVDGKDCFCDVQCRCWAAVLVTDDLQTIARCRQTEDRFQKIVAVLPIYPSRSDNDRVSVSGANKGLTAQFRSPVNTKRSHCIGFDIRSMFRTVENVVGRQVQQRQPCPRRKKSDILGAASVNGLCAFTLLFFTIDRRIRGCIHYQMRSGLLHYPSNRVRRHDVDFLMRDCAQFCISGFGQPGELTSNLARRPKYENGTHHTPPALTFPSLCPLYRPERIGFHQSLFAKYQLTVFRRPDSKVSLGIHPSSRLIFDASMA